MVDSDRMTMRSSVPCSSSTFWSLLGIQVKRLTLPLGRQVQHEGSEDRPGVAEHRPSHERQRQRTETDEAVVELLQRKGALPRLVVLAELQDHQLPHRV